MSADAILSRIPAVVNDEHAVQKNVTTFVNESPGIGHQEPGGGSRWIGHRRREIPVRATTLARRLNQDLARLEPARSAIELGQGDELAVAIEQRDRAGRDGEGVRDRAREAVWPWVTASTWRASSTSRGKPATASRRAANAVGSTRPRAPLASSASSSVNGPIRVRTASRQAPASQRLADVAGDRSDVGPAAAIDFELQMRPVVLEDRDPVDPDRARGQLERLAGPGQVVGSPALDLQSRIGRWSLQRPAPRAGAWPAGPRRPTGPAAMSRLRSVHPRRACRCARPGGSRCDTSWASLLHLLDQPGRGPDADDQDARCQRIERAGVTDLGAGTGERPGRPPPAKSCRGLVENQDARLRHVQS